MRPPCLLLLFLYYLRFVICHPTKPNRLDRRDDKIPLGDRLKDVSVHLLGGANNDDEVGHFTINYGQTKRGLGLGSDKDTGIFVETNFGIWGCRIQETVLDRIIGKTRNQNKNGRTYIVYSPEPRYYQELFERRCLQEMDQALLVWSTTGDGSFEFRVAASQFYTLIGRTSRKVDDKTQSYRAPFGQPTIRKMAEDMTKLLRKYDPTYERGVRLLGPFVGDAANPLKEGIVVQQEAISDNGPAKVNVYASGSGHETTRKGPKKSGQGTGASEAIEIEMPWSSIFLKKNWLQSGCQDEDYWVPSEYIYGFGSGLDAQSQVAFKSFTGVWHADKLPLLNEDLFSQAYPDQ